MNPQGGDLLSQLRDIHGAPDAPWWPPAPGWWLLALLLALGLFFLFRRGLQHHRALQRRRHLNGFIDRVELEVDPRLAPQEFLSSVNRVFKIVALRAFPENHCAFLKGSEWVDFVRSRLSGEGPARDLAALADGPYQPAPVFDAQALTALARKWIARYG
jgi:hypothetical protein